MRREVAEQRPGPMSATTRRTVVGALVASPVVAVLARWSGRLRRNAGSLRPAADGRSSQRCASCGAGDHSMLSCPSNPKVI